MKITIVRDAGPNEQEIESYVGLQSVEELSLIVGAKNKLFEDSRGFRVRRVYTSNDLLAHLPYAIRRYASYAMTHVLEVSAIAIGLRRLLVGTEIVHTPDASYYYSYQVAKYKRDMGFKHVITQWENIPFNFGKTVSASKRLRAVYNSADLILAVSERARAALILEGVESGKIEVFRHGIDTRRFAPDAFARAEVRSRLRISKEDVVLLFIGRVVRSKGIVTLLYALKRLLEDSAVRKRGVVLVIAGQGKLSGEVVQFAGMLGLTRDLRVLGVIPYEDVPAVTNAADICVVPSVVSPRWQEQYGFVLLESMACGKAVVCSASGSIPEVVGNAAELVQAEDHWSLSAALRAMILDCNRREDLGCSARKRVCELFDAREAAVKLRQLYKQL